MQTDSMPIELFVQTTIVKPAMAEMMTGWRFEQKVLEDVLISALREMGIFMVPPRHISIVTKAIVAQLKHSPEIKRMLNAAQREMQMKQQSRHSE